MSIRQIYTALERGVVQAACGDLDTNLEMGLYKFLHVTYMPAFNQTGIVMIANAKKWDNLPQKVRDFLTAETYKFEEITRKQVEDRTAATIAALKKHGMKFIDLKGKTAEHYVDTYMKTPWGRMRNNPKVGPETTAELHKAWY